MISDALISQVKTLNVADRIELIGAVWETLSPKDIPISEQEKVLLDTRLADIEQNPEEYSLWSEVQTRLKRQLP